MRLFRFYVSLALLLSVPMSVLAYTNNQIINIGDYTIKVLNASNNTASLIGCSKTGHVELPATIFDGTDVTFTITEISTNGTSWNSGITSVTIPSTVTTLADACFQGARITTLHIPNNVTNIRRGLVFDNMKFLESFTVDDDNPNFEVKDDCLYRKGLTSLIRVPAAKVYNDGVFEIPEGCIATEYYFLSGDKNKITKLIVPTSVTELDYGCGQLCTTLKSFEVAAANTVYASQDGVLFNKAMTQLLKYPIGKEEESYKVPDGVTTIVGNGIRNNHIKSIDLNQVSELKEDALFYCHNLETVTIPTTLTSIEGGIASCTGIKKYIVKEGHPTYFADDAGVVYTNDKLKLLLYPPARTGEYVIPSDYGVTEIAKNAFRGSKITSVTIPNSVKIMNENAFYLCGSLSDVKFEEDSQLKTVGTNCFRSCANLKKIDLPETVETIDDYSFQGTALTSFTVPMNTKTIGVRAFNSTKKLETVIVPDGSKLEKIYSHAFLDCTSLKTFTFKGSCTLDYIYNNCFRGATSLQSFAMPASVTTIGTNAFSGCSSLEEVTFADNAVIQTIATAAFADCGIERITLPTSLKTIQDEAFRNCTALETVAVGVNASSISPTAFLHCENLTAFDVDRANTTYASSDGVLLNANKEKLILFPPGKANSRFTLLPPSLKEIGEKSFYSCEKLTNVTIPNKVEKIGSRAFGLCSNLNTVTFLCDEMIAPDNIAQAKNEAAFDDGNTTTDSQFGKIAINVRKDLLTQYQGSTYYQQFKSISPSFVDEESDGKEEYIAVSDNAVDLLDTQNGDYTYLLPQSVTKDGKSYTVSLIGDYCFQNLGTDGPKEVVVSDNVEYIGAKAFMTDIATNSSVVENIFFIESAPTKQMLSTTRFELDDTKNDYSEIAATTKVYVKKSALDKYKEVFARYVEDAYDYNHTQKVRTATADMFQYQIPYSPEGSVYGTLSREFAIDLSDQDDEGSELLWNTTEDCPNVIAFTAGKKAKGPGDTEEGSETEYHVHMTSINLGDDGDGTYVPANTGVLIKIIDSGKLPTGGAYYRIAETQAAGYPGENLLSKVVVNPKTIEPNATGYDKSNPYYVMASDNLLHAVKNNNYTLATHEAYLQLPQEAGGKRLVLSFGESTATAIVAVQGSTAEQAAEGDVLYDLQGRRVESPQKGLYIRNGRKVIVR